jgi:hypothetical protein
VKWWHLRWVLSAARQRLPQAVCPAQPEHRPCSTCAAPPCDCIWQTLSLAPDLVDGSGLRMVSAVCLAAVQWHVLQLDRCSGYLGWDSTLAKPPAGRDGLQSVLQPG